MEGSENGSKQTSKEASQGGNTLFARFGMLSVLQDAKGSCHSHQCWCSVLPVLVLAMLLVLVLPMVVLLVLLVVRASACAW